VIVLKSGALPAPVRILEERSVGASLGPELIRRGSKAGAGRAPRRAGVHGVLLTGSRGVVADVALVLNGLVVLAIHGVDQLDAHLAGNRRIRCSRWEWRWDANVLINERIREELRAGKSIGPAIKNGYERGLLDHLRRARHGAGGRLRDPRLRIRVRCAASPPR